MENPTPLDGKSDVIPALASARGSAAFIPDHAGFWWWKRKGHKVWEMVRVYDFGGGNLCAYSMETNWGGWTMSPASEHFVGEWVECLPPNESSSATRPAETHK